MRITEVVETKSIKKFVCDCCDKEFPDRFTCEYHEKVEKSKTCNHTNLKWELTEPEYYEITAKCKDCNKECEIVDFSGFSEDQKFLQMIVDYISNQQKEGNRP